MEHVNVDGAFCEWMRSTCRSSSAMWGCHEEGTGHGTTSQGFPMLTGRTKLLSWPGIRAAALEHALDTQTLQKGIK
eukprot:353124-Chlamydomonas_euryale.AAC.2